MVHRIKLDLNVLQAAHLSHCVVDRVKALQSTVYSLQSTVYRLQATGYTPAICEALRSSLVEISSSEENSFVASIVQLHNDRSVWCGLQDLAEDGHFVWTSSLEKPDYINWVPDQPDEDGGNEDCVEVLNNGQWNDEQCVDYRSYPLCEQP
ncbi:hypothetical protein C0Q70_08628 [Pomacea canaliculata]|uniref:C-type lectin domain-containing protein n=1 Tax=Pomacea canaliculata TaxID=400727 RepID=A0A2T7P7H4_POMCA|nr:hypothetical protein C0Q70_08628 [Pomacea canaliculata]